MSASDVSVIYRWQQLCKNDIGQYCQSNEWENPAVMMAWILDGLHGPAEPGSPLETIRSALAKCGEVTT